MIKGFRLIIVTILTILFVTAGFSQNKKYNALYRPLPLAKRLSYENFKNIKLLQSAILNYGGGESEIEKLIDQYAEASALYFQSKFEQSASKFSENKREILEAAKNLAKKYRTDSEKLLIDSIKLNIKTSLKDSLKGEKKNRTAENLLRNAQYGVQKANDFYDRYINSTNAPPYELVKAIYYYREAKKHIFMMYESLKIDEDQKKNFFENHKRDIDDNSNRIHRSMEKKN